MRYLTLLLILLSAPLDAQEVKLPAEIKAAPGAWFIVAPEAIDGGVPKWRVDTRLQEVRLDLLFPPDIADKAKGKVFTGATGRYKIEAWNAKGDIASDIATCWVIIGDAPPIPPTPVPVPPTPVPVPPDPTPAGSRSVIIIRETAETTAQLARLITNLRQGPSAEYLKSKKHSLTVLDDDAVGSDGRPSPSVEAWRPHFSTMTLPVLIIADPATQTLLRKMSLPADATDDTVLNVLKAYGG